VHAERFRPRSKAKFRCASKVQIWLETLCVLAVAVLTDSTMFIRNLPLQLSYDLTASSSASLSFSSALSTSSSNLILPSLSFVLFQATPASRAIG